jgi:hypothetical protein
MPVKEKPNVFGMPTKTSEHTPPPPAKTQMIELRKLLLSERGDAVVKKVIDIALDDEHPVQGAALKMCMDRLLPMTEFEKAQAGGRPAITINISGISDAPTIIEGETKDVDG